MSGQVVIVFDTGNDAFEFNGVNEYRYVLGQVPIHLLHGEPRGTLLDSNGNSVGHWYRIERDSVGRVTKGGR